MKTFSLICHRQAELPQTAKSILEIAGGKKIFCFYGELGAGKTTLIKEICKQLGVADKGSSPTFSLINEYRTATPSLKGEYKDNSSLQGGGHEVSGFHFDLYRLKSESEIYDIGYEEYLFSGHYCFIEWPEKIERLLPNDVVKVRIEIKDEERIIRIS